MHIVPLGYDHILFVLGLFLLKPKLKSVLTQITTFTIAHSITLALAMTGTIHPNAGMIEPFIALSIVFVGIENLMTSEIHWWRLVIVFMFGLVHGCGFAGVLSEIGLPEKTFIPALISFNLGVEIGQSIVILAAILLFQSWKSDQSWYRKRITIPVSACISILALFWTIERILA
jgi:hydrogenase/urease accessory protein HupE